MVSLLFLQAYLYSTCPTGIKKTSETIPSKVTLLLYIFLSKAYLSSALYFTVLCGNKIIIERNPHSWPFFVHTRDGRRMAIWGEGAGANSERNGHGSAFFKNPYS